LKKSGHEHDIVNIALQAEKTKQLEAEERMKKFEIEGKI